MSRNPFDDKKILEHTNGDRELFKKTVSYFLVNVNHYLEDLKHAAASGDNEDLVFCAHRLRETLLKLCAVHAAREALALELMGRKHHLAHVPKVLGLLENEVQRLNEYVEQCLKGPLEGA